MINAFEYDELLYPYKFPLIDPSQVGPAKVALAITSPQALT
jgi:hypothetical protein